MKREANSADGATVIQRLLMGLVDGVSRRPGLVLTAALVLCGLSIFAALRFLEYRTQRTDLVSPDKDYQKRWRAYVAEFGDDDDIVVVVQGADRQRMRQALDRIATGVAAERNLFDRLFYQVDLRHLSNRALLFLPAEQIEQIRDYLRSPDMRLLLEPTLAGAVDLFFNLRWRMVALEQILGKAGSVAAKLRPGHRLTGADEQIVTQLAAISQAATANLKDAAAYRNPWQSLIPPPAGQQASEKCNLLTEPQYFFSGDGSLAFLLVRPKKDPKSFTGAAASVAALRGIVDRARPEFGDLRIGLTGLPVLETDEMTASEKDTHLASWLALAGVALLFLIVYRGLRNPFLTVTTLLVGTTWAMGWTTLTVGHLNILSATFAVMLIGMGDYGVLWVTRYEQYRAAGADVRTALRRTAAGGGPSILTAATATALAFFAAMLADFQAVAELGWIAGSGVLFCALSCFTVLPVLLMLFDRRPAEEAAGPPEVEGGDKLVVLRMPPSSRRRVPLAQFPRVADSWLPVLARRPRLVIGVSLALTAVLAVFAFRVTYDYNLLHLQAEGLDSVQWELTLINHTAGANWHALSYTKTPEKALALKARYEQHAEVSRVVEVASLVPQGQGHKREQLRDIQHRLRCLPERGVTIAHARPNPGRLKARLDAILDRLPAGAGRPAVAALCHSLHDLRATLEAMPEDVAAGRLRTFEERLTADLVENLHRLRDVSTPEPITVDDLPSSLRERYVGKTGKWLLRVFARDCLWDHEPLQRFADQVRMVDAAATGKPFATLEGLESLKKGFQWAGLYALAAIVLVFLADFRHLRRTLLALTPLAMGVVISLGIMGLCGLSLNPANIIAFPLILGVGAVYGVHVVHDYLVRRATRPYTLSYIIGRAILVMALTNMISFGTLTLSSHRGLAGLGFTLMLGVGCCMLTALVFLPAVLRLFSTPRPVAEVVPQTPARSARVAA
jgi:hopanoid biosynthesis associated RND transporter like protein HpnN